MVLEQIVKDILKEEYSTMRKQVDWDGMFDKAADYWKNAIRLAPNNYIEAQNWLKITGKLTNDMN